MAGASELQKAIDRLTKAEPDWKAFDKKPAVGGRPGAVSTGRGVGGASAGALSLVESDATLREYHAARTLTTSDGIFSIEWEPIKKVMLVGGGSMQFQDPPGAPAP